MRCAGIPAYDVQRANVQKCTGMSIHQLISRYQDYTYKMNDVALIRTMEQNYLGVMLTSDLKWNTHISNIASKANRSLGLMKRSLQMCQQDAKALAYTSLVRWHLENASSTWDPHTDSNKYKLEAVQHGASHFVTRNYNWKIPEMSIVQELDWRNLEQRRREHSLKLMFKVVNGQSELKMSDYYNQRTQQITHQSLHEKCYVLPQCRTDTHQQSYFPWTIREWNVLSPDLVTAAVWTHAAPDALDTFTTEHSALPLGLMKQCSFAELTTGIGSRTCKSTLLCIISLHW